MMMILKHKLINTYIYNYTYIYESRFLFIKVCSKMVKLCNHVHIISVADFIHYMRLRMTVVDTNF